MTLPPTVPWGVPGPAFSGLGLPLLPLHPQGLITVSIQGGSDEGKSPWQADSNVSP